MKFIKILIVMMIMALPVFSQTGMPSITVTESEKEFTLPIKRAKIDVKIVGSLAITTYDIHFFNPNKRTLEGQLDFPLADGVIVSRFGMDVNEKLREGVIVEKDKGRVTYENIVNRGVDPGLLEVTRGNNFRSRVYPLLPEKEKHIVIAYEEELKVTPDGLKYSLPLDMPNQLDEFSFKATIYSDFAKPINNSTNSSKFRHKDDSYTLLSEYTDYKAKELYEFIIPYFGEESIQLETYNNEDFFRISLNPDMMLQLKEKPKTISILWDISASRLNSDIDKDLELLEEYLKYNKCNVELVPFSLYADEPSYFPNVDFEELKANINGMRIDGATNYSSVDISKLRGDEIFIFSDGIDNIGEGSFGESEKPMYVINSSSISDHDVCRKLAQKTGGKYINLIDENTQSALNLLTYNFPYFMGIDGAAGEVYPKNEVVKGNINISGKLESSSQLKLKFGYGDKVAKTIPVNITEANRTNSGILHKIWAKQKLADLNLNQTQNEKEITELGKKYSLVTAFTSLIVLETAWDYYGYKIEPPAELRDEYEEIRKDYEQMNTSHEKRLIEEGKQILTKEEEEEKRFNRLKERVKNTVSNLKRWYEWDFEYQAILDSCYTEIDSKIKGYIDSIRKNKGNNPYLVIDLKEFVPEEVFQNSTYLNIMDFSYVKKNHSYYYARRFETVFINNNEIKLRWNSKSSYTGYQTKNFKRFTITADTVNSLVFTHKLKSFYPFGLASKYKDQRNVYIDSTNTLKINIESKDCENFKSKLYVLEDIDNLLSYKNFELIENWKNYSTAVNNVIDSVVDNMVYNPNEKLYEIIDLDKILPEYKEFHNKHFKYYEMSKSSTYWNLSNKDIYDSSSYKYYTEISLRDTFHYNRDYFEKNNSNLSCFEMPLRSHRNKTFERNLSYNNSTLPYYKYFIDMKFLPIRPLYLVSNVSYNSVANIIRPKYAEQLANIDGKLAIKISSDQKKLKASELYIFKNIAMVYDTASYFQNITSKCMEIRNRGATLEYYDTVANLIKRIEENTKNATTSKVSNNNIASLELMNYLGKGLRFALNDKSYRKLELEGYELYDLSNSYKFSKKDNLVKEFYGAGIQSQNYFITQAKLDSLRISGIDSLRFIFKYNNQHFFDFNKEPLNSSELIFNRYDSTFSLCRALNRDTEYLNNTIIIRTPQYFWENDIENKKCTHYFENTVKVTPWMYGAIKGKVKDENGKPLPGATIMLLGTKKGAKSKPDGSYLIYNVMEQYYDIRATHVAKRTCLIEDVLIKKDSIVNLIIIMEDKVTDIAKVVVMSTRASSFEEQDQRLVGSVEMIEYQSSKAYYKALSSVALGELEDTYFELRKENQMNPSFFFDAAKVFEKQGKIKEACRVMSNLAEINLEDHENLRRVGGFLMEHKEFKLASSIYKHLIQIRSEETQSFRDYALCLAELGEYQTAADSIYSLFTRELPWEYYGIRISLITEFNTLLSQHKGDIDISNYDPQFIVETPVDLRIEISWVMDETDIDLWVLEPDSTKCYFRNRYTRNGGFLSEDMTQGYGPEVYMIRNAESGTYKIKANYYSNDRQKTSLEPQIRCKIYTNYGRPNQQMKENIIKIEIDKGEVELGEIVIE